MYTKFFIPICAKLPKMPFGEKYVLLRYPLRIHQSRRDIGGFILVLIIIFIEIFKPVGGTFLVKEVS